MERRAFTLMELLIAIAVMVAIMSLVMPTVYARLSTSRGQEARSMIDASVIKARAIAARTGDAVRVFAHERSDGSVDIVHHSMRTDGTDASFDELIAPLISGVEADEQTIAPLRHAEIDVTLPPGCRIILMSALEAYQSVEALELDHEEHAISEPDRTIAVTLPDGAALAAQSLALITPRQRAYELSVRSWGGGVSFVRWEPVEEGALGVELP